MLGLGVGGHLSLGPFGIRTERPVGMLREAIATARAVLSRADGDGYSVPGHAMPSRAVPIWVGARGPQLVRTAARYADGLFLSGCSPAQLDEIVEQAGPTGRAVYQSASDRPGSDSEHRWDEVVDVLAAAVRRHEPESVGINLVETAGGADPVEQVLRAAKALAQLSRSTS